MENIDELKLSITDNPKYTLREGNLHVSPGGLHFMDYLDPIEDISAEIDASLLTDTEANYIEKLLQSNPEKFDSQVTLFKTYVQERSSKVLDLGCGGGLFLSKVKNLGYIVLGSEMSDSRAQYAKTVHGLEIHKRTIESPFWLENYAEYFDAVTIWDVIEHVNFPRLTLLSCNKILNEGGFVFIDTPCRDSFYHRFGELSYKATRGKFPTFLNTMYSSQKFGHKQIFSTEELKSLLESVGFEVILQKKFHELTFPYDFYLKKVFRSELLVKMVLPFVSLFFFVFVIKNKMVVVARKK